MAKEPEGYQGEISKDIFNLKKRKCKSSRQLLLFTFLIPRLLDSTKKQYEFNFLHSHLIKWICFKFLKIVRPNLNKLSKGQLILKCLFGVFNSSKKRTKTIRPELYDSTEVELFRSFFGRIEDTMSF